MLTLLYHIIVILFIFLLLCSSALFAKPVTLPLFSVQDIQSATVQSDQLSQDSQWVLFYIRWDCRSCENIIRALEELSSSPSRDRVVILVGGGNNDFINALRGTNEKISSFGWYSDPAWQAYAALEISGTPIVFGIKEGKIEWMFAGTPWDMKTMGSILVNWVNY